MASLFNLTSSCGSMGAMRLWCGVYGNATVFPITVARGAEVYDLHTAIYDKQGYRQRFQFYADDMKLYKAKKDDAWLKGGHSTADLLLGPVDKTYPRMFASWKLNHEAYFGSEFQPGEQEIHVLVELPTGVFASNTTRPLTNTRVAMNADAGKLVKRYTDTAVGLKDHALVAQLVDVVRYVTAETYTRPFIVLESSSGTGKTQMAFNLMARDDIETHYVVCQTRVGIVSPWGVHSAFDTRTKTFLECVERDLERDIEDGEMVRDAEELRLHTFEFVRALLSGADKMASNDCAYEDVYKMIKSRTRQPLIFLDDFPLLDEAKQDEVRLRFMRNVFRTLGLPVILSATHGTARGLIIPCVGTTSTKIDARWCVVMPELPRFHDSEIASLTRRDVAVFVERSRPRFARFALDYMIDHTPPSLHHDPQTITYLDDLARALAGKCREWKRSCLEWFRAGQVCLFLSADVIKPSDADDTRDRLVHGHFARLQEPTMFELRLNRPASLDKWDLEPARDGGLVGKRLRFSKRWRVHTILPAVDQDVLLYLSLMGGKDHYAFTDQHGKRVSFFAATREWPSRRLLDFTLGHPHHSSSDAEIRARIEAMTAAAMVSASHCNGFAGIPLSAFLVEMMFELSFGSLSLKEKQDWRRAIPPSLHSRQVPFLAPPDTQWPEGLPKALKLGAITHVEGSDGKVDWCIDDGWLTATIQSTDADGEPQLTQEAMQTIMDRVHPSCAVHVVVTNQHLQAAYFEDESFEEYMRVKCPHLMSTVFLGCSVDGRVRSIGGMKRRESSADRVVLILSRPPTPVEEECELSTSSATSVANDAVKKKKVRKRVVSQQFGSMSQFPG